MAGHSDVRLLAYAEAIVAGELPEGPLDIGMSSHESGRFTSLVPIMISSMQARDRLIVAHKAVRVGNGDDLFDRVLRSCRVGDVGNAHKFCVFRN